MESRKNRSAAQEAAAATAASCCCDYRDGRIGGKRQKLSDA